MRRGSLVARTRISNRAAQDHAAQAHILEKATAVHVFCTQGDIEGDRISRHWHDLVRLDDEGYAQAAFDDNALAKEVADWKSKFFRVRDRNGEWIDYHVAVSGKLQIGPDEKTRKELQADYQKMADAGLLLGDAVPFDEIMKRCETLQKRANSRKCDLILA
jgi:hypothetical protein